MAIAIIYATWIGASVSELKTEIAALKVQLEYSGRSTDSRVTLSNATLEDKIADIKVELDKLHHNDEMLGEKLLTIEHAPERRRR